MPSDNGVDRYVEALFPDVLHGYACEVGANNGLFGSNTLIFEQLGWTVLCVEPNPLHAEHGRANRRLWREVACSDEDSDEGLFSSIGDYPYGSNSSLVGETESQTPSPVGVRNNLLVKVRRLDRVLEEAGFPRLDFLSVDVEGWERRVMAGFTVERWKPKVIVLEEWSTNAIEIPGYTIKTKLTYDNIYTEESRMSTVFTMPGKAGDALHQWPVVFHYLRQSNDPDVELWLDEKTCKNLVPLFEAQPGIKAVKLVGGVENWNCGGQPFHMNLPTSAFSGNRIYHLGLRGFPIRQLSLQCLNDAKVPVDVTPEVFADTRSLEVGPVIGRNRLVIHGKAVYPHTRQSPSMWRFLASISQDIHELFEEVVFVGDERDREVGLTTYPNWTAFDDGGDFLKLARFIAESRCMIGVGSSPIVLAGLLKVPAVRVHDQIGDGAGAPRAIWDNLGSNQLNRTAIELRTEWPKFRDRWLKGVASEVPAT